MAGRGEQESVGERDVRRDTTRTMIPRHQAIGPSRRRETVSPSLLLLATFFLQGCAVHYVIQSGWYEGMLLAGRQPIARVIERGSLPADRAEKLALVPRIKDWGHGVGLARTRNYETINLGWNRTVWNFSACQPLSFEPRTWWFPIVGRVPYLGFFRERDAERYTRRYASRGDDVWVRSVDAWSTLGWFRDPVLPAMLAWEESRIAETVLHELAHATLWAPGNVDFNETFASVTGEVAAVGWMKHAHGGDSEPVRALVQAQTDLQTWLAIVRGLFKELDTLYRRTDLDDEAKLYTKKELIASLPDRVTASPIHDQDRYLNAARASDWNNARLYQHRTYDNRRDLFDRILHQEDGDIKAFIEHIRRVTHRRDDPWAALAEEVEALPSKHVKNL